MERTSQHHQLTVKNYYIVLTFNLFFRLLFQCLSDIFALSDEFTSPFLIINQPFKERRMQTYITHEAVSTFIFS